MAEWLCSGLQSRGRRFDSDPSLHFYLPSGEINMNTRGNHRSCGSLLSLIHNVSDSVCFGSGESVQSNPWLRSWSCQVFCRFHSKALRIGVVTGKMHPLAF